MKITTTVIVGIERSNGTTTTITERFTHECGENPDFESIECTRAITRAAAVTNSRFVKEQP